METATGKINVEEFKLWLTRQKTTRDLFRWECSADEAYNMLYSAYEREVAVRGMTCHMNSKICSYLRTIAEMMISKSVKCGILLCGTCGNGKTTTLNAFMSVCKYLDIIAMRKSREKGEAPKIRTFADTSSRRIVQLAKNELAMDEAKTVHVLCIDDIGLEPTEVLDYGNSINPIIEILEQRYRKQLFTFITTNLTPKQIREKYGDRIADRFNEIMNCIVYEVPTFRK